MGMIGGTASIEVDAPIQRCYELLEDVETAPSWQGGLDRMEVIERDAQGRPALVETSTDAKVKVITTKVRFSYSEPDAVTWTQEKGDLKSVDGAWRLRALGEDRTEVTYQLDGDPGRMLGMLIRGPVEGEIRKRLVEQRPGEFKEHLASQ